ncbi:MAG: PorT family protein [Muribaculaceae bacterium]|nr:PorT family protein [Muribaculaceae bacterium]
MRKLLTLIILAATAISASAEFRWGPQIGWNMSNFYWRQPLLKSQQKSGFQAGVLGELMIPGIGFGIDIGARYAYHASTVNLGDQYIWSSDGYENGNFDLHRIEVPLHLRFKWTRMDGLEQYVAPFAFVGPVFAFNVSQTKCNAIEHPLGSVGLEFGLGGEFLERIQLSASYTWGVSYDIRTVKLDNMSASSSSWNINVAYLF